MSNNNIKSTFPRFSNLVIVYFISFLSLSITTNGSTMHTACGKNIELRCPINALKKPDEVISWFRPNSSQSHLTFIAIGDILFPEYATVGRFNLISSEIPRLSISHVLTEDQGIYICKSSSSGQHSIKLLVHSHPDISPSSPLLLYPVNRTFSITCSLLCDAENNLNDLTWLINGELLTQTEQDFRIDTISSSVQRLTVYLNKKNRNFNQANFTCKYNGKEASIFVRRHTKEELHRLPRQPDSSAQYLLQTLFDSSPIHYQSSYLLIFFSVILVALLIA